MRQPVNKQIANNALSRGLVKPRSNKAFSSLAVNTFDCPLPLTFIVKKHSFKYIMTQYTQIVYYRLLILSGQEHQAGSLYGEEDCFFVAKYTPFIRGKNKTIKIPTLLDTSAPPSPSGYQNSNHAVNAIANASAASSGRGT